MRDDERARGHKNLDVRLILCAVVATWFVVIFARPRPDDRWLEVHRLQCRVAARELVECQPYEIGTVGPDACACALETFVRRLPTDVNVVAVTDINTETSSTDCEPIGYIQTCGSLDLLVTISLPRE